MDSKKIALSKSILEMKFMKRTKDKVEKQQFQEEGEQYFGNQLTVQNKTSGIFVTNPSYVSCEELTDGRLSFQGMNPLIEKLMEIRDNTKRIREEVKQETDISDEQMSVQWQKMRAKFNTAKVYSTKFNTVNKHRKPQRRKMNDEDEPMKKKPKFLKPVD